MTCPQAQSSIPWKWASDGPGANLVGGTTRGGESTMWVADGAREDLRWRKSGRGHCQSEVAGLSYSTEDRGLGRPELTPLGECSAALELEVVP